VFGDQERIAGEDDGDVVMPSGEGATFEVIQAEQATDLAGASPVGTAARTRARLARMRARASR
jgi:hypothetical protein